MWWPVTAACRNPAGLSAQRCRCSLSVVHCVLCSRRDCGKQQTHSQGLGLIVGLSLPQPQHLMCCWRQPAYSRTNTAM
jgi:hypothetical protein